MKAVANSSVLIALSTIGQLELLPRRFSEGVLVPQAVWREVVEMGKGQPGSEEVASASWVEVCEVRDIALVSLLRGELDEGEAEAIALAREEQVPLVLLDEKDARRVARRLNLRVLGIVGLLIWAKRIGVIPSLREQLDTLQTLGRLRYMERIWVSVVRKLTIAALTLIWLALHSRTLAAAVLHNGAGLSLFSHWREATGAGGFPVCGSQATSSPAGAWIERALCLNPQDERAWLLQGRAAWLAGRCDEALQDWERALSMSPQDRAAWALYLAAGGKNLRPDPATAEGVAAYFLFLGDRSQKAEAWEGAQRWYTLAFSLHPTAAGARKLEALYLRLEQKERAVAVWEELAAYLPVMALTQLCCVTSLSLWPGGAAGEG